MTSSLLTFLVKLPLALFVFLLIAYAGTVSRRIAGVLFTFPILNGVAIIASPEPTVVADAIYPLVIFNCALFALVISYPDALPPAGALPRGAKLFARVGAWSLAWLAGAYLITDFRAHAGGTVVLFAGATVIAILFMIFFWTRDSQMRGAFAERPGAPHWPAFKSFWVNSAGLGRIAFFIVAYACLFWASRVALDEKWVGMASALPLPGFFALAALIDDAEHTPARSTVLLPIRDTLFLGPVLVIPFNWMFSHALLAVPPDALVARYALLVGFWAVAALAVLVVVPRIETHFDRR